MKKRTKRSLLISGIILSGAVFSIMLHNVIFGILEFEEPVFFTLGALLILAAPFSFIITAAHWLKEKNYFMKKKRGRR